MSCGTCKNCRHWNNGGTSAKGECKAEFVKFGYGSNPSKSPADAVHVENDEGWGWITGPDFGCVHFESRV